MNKLFSETFVRTDDCGSAYSADRTETTHIAWVDELSFTRDVIPRALLNSDNSFAITKFPTVKDCICHADRQFDAVLYHCHDEQFSSFSEVAMLSDAYPDAQIVLLSDSSTLDKQAFGKALKSGASTYLLSQFTSLKVFVKTLANKSARQNSPGL